MNPSSVECYRYLQQGQRAVKFSQCTAGQLCHQVQYFPGLERRWTKSVSPSLLVLTLQQMKILQRRTAGMKEMRHSLQDCSGSYNLELDL
jgi:hypothetical protein